MLLTAIALLLLLTMLAPLIFAPPQLLAPRPPRRPQAADEARS